MGFKATLLNLEFTRNILQIQMGIHELNRAAILAITKDVCNSPELTLPERVVMFYTKRHHILPGTVVVDEVDEIDSESESISNTSTDSNRRSGATSQAQGIVTKAKEAPIGKYVT